MTSLLFKPYRVACYYVTLALFGVTALIVNVACLGLVWLPASPARERAVRRIIHRLFRLLQEWIALNRIVCCEFHGFDRLQGRTPTVVVANHPGLMDFTLLLSQLPHALCLFKSALRRNPLLGPAAMSAGYVAGDRGFEGVRDAALRVAAGETLVIFPEGTRTAPGHLLQPLHAGFALIATRAKARICVVTIRTNSNLFAKGRAWWKLPVLPVRLAFEVTLELPPDPSRRTAATVAAIEAHWRNTLAMPLTFDERKPAEKSNVQPAAAFPT